MNFGTLNNGKPLSSADILRIGWPQGICWESHDVPGREPRLVHAQTPEDSGWLLSLAASPVCCCLERAPKGVKAEGQAAGEGRMVGGMLINSCFWTSLANIAKSNES